METSPASIDAPLGFTRPEDASPDSERPGLLRARAVANGPRTAEFLDFHTCSLHDCCAPGATPPRLESAGFETLDLSGNSALQAALARVRDEDRLSEAGSAAIRAALRDAEFELAGGKRLRVQHVAEDGMIHRRAGPNDLDVNPGGMDGANAHGGAQAVHGDQDVFGTPLKQMMKGGAPQLFRHITPDARNDESSLFLLNLWIPIQQITRPLVLMDRRTLDAPRHQLRYGLQVTRFLDRDEEQSINDIWTFLHDDAQEWHFRSEMGPDQAWVFDTLGEPHGASVLPGEDALESLYLALARACEAAEAADTDALRQIAATEPPPLPETTTAAVREAWRRMDSLLRGAADAASDLGSGGAAWTERARAAMDAVVRKSLEMRMVASLSSP